MDKYKLGKFVYLYHLNEGYVLFNLINDAVVLLNDEGVNLIKKYENKLHEIRKIHPSLFKSLLNSKFIVAKELDEVERMIAQWREEDCAEYKFTLTVNPTLGCNLRCWYCYEAHEGMSIMGQGVLGRVMKLIENKVGNPKLRGFNLDFFGGEPLLAFAKVVRPLMTYTKDICRKYKKQYYFSFTTNAVLLNAEIIDYLKKSGEYAPVRLQITLDGSEQFHDATRSTVTGSPTYRLILHNIKASLNAGLDIIVRYNYTSQNAASFRDILLDLDDINRNLRLVFSFNRVWQEKETPFIESLIDSIKADYESAGFNVECVPLVRGIRCYADKENFIVVNYDGFVYKCTARDFRKENADGVLSENGIIEWNPRFYDRMRLKFGNEDCLKCSIFPICHGGCSQSIIECQDRLGCIKNYDEPKRESLIAERLYCILHKNNVIYHNEVV